MNKLFINLAQGQMVYKNIKLLVFDMAGTTIKENGIVNRTLFHTIQKLGHPVDQLEVDSWQGLNKYDVLAKYTVDKSDSEKMNIYSEFNDTLKCEYFIANHVQLVDDKLPDIFENIRNRNIKIALNTEYNYEIQNMIVERLQMGRYIDDYISSDMVESGRPLPYMINRLMERNKISHPSQVIKFGDTKMDILEGINAKCRASIGVLSGSGGEYDFKLAHDILPSIISIE